MKVYVVTKEGVYRHEIYGAYEKPETALEIAKDLIGKEKDDYHKFEVSEVSDKPTEDVTVFTVRRIDREIVVTDWRKK